MKILQHIGRIFLAFLATAGRLALFMGSAEGPIEMAVRA